MIPDNPFILHSKLFDSVSKNDYPKKVKAYTDSYYMNEVKIESISKILILNRKYLSRIFKEKYNITMQEYLIKKRMQEAKKMLNTGYGVEQTAYMVWYNDSFNFLKAFKKYYNISPINCRN